MRRVSSWEPVLGTCDCGHGLQPWLNLGHDRPKQLHVVQCGHVCVGKRRDSVCCVYSGRMVRARRKHSNQLRCGELPQHDGRDIAE